MTTVVAWGIYSAIGALVVVVWWLLDRIVDELRAIRYKLPSTPPPAIPPSLLMDAYEHLQAREWCGENHDVHSEAPEYFCPGCGNTKEDGHSENCFYPELMGRLQEAADAR